MTFPAFFATLRKNAERSFYNESISGERQSAPARLHRPRAARGRLEQGGIETEIFWIGNQPIGGCIGCGACAKLGRCAFDGVVNEFAEKLDSADGFVFGSPVHYAAASGSMTSFLGRLFYSASEKMRGKPAAVVVSARRGGTTAAYEQLRKYPGICQMPIISSCYGNMVHGSCAEEVEQDLEGLRTMRVLGHNMAYFLHCLAAGRAAGVPLPPKEPPARTNFIR